MKVLSQLGSILYSSLLFCVCCHECGYYGDTADFIKPQALLWYIMHAIALYYTVHHIRRTHCSQLMDRFL